MYDLKFDPSLCEQCEGIDCVMKCQYIHMTLEQARAEQRKLAKGAHSPILDECVTCYACEEYCPFNNHPFYHIVELQEKLGVHPAPKPIEESQVRMMSPRGRIDYEDLTEPVIDLCFFPMFRGAIRGKLFEGASVIMGSDVFCNLMFLHFARNSAIKDRLPLIIDNIMNYYLKRNNIEELVCFHDECYGTFTKWAPAFGIEVPFKPVHLFEYLRGRLTELRSEIKPLNISIAYQRNCSTRLIPEIEDVLNDVFALIGVRRVEREYDYENALCCGGPMEAQQRFDLAEENQNKNVNDMKKAGVTHCVFNCPFCFFTLMEKVSKAGIMPIMMTDLCQQALGE